MTAINTTTTTTTMEEHDPQPRLHMHSHSHSHHHHHVPIAPHPRPTLQKADPAPYLPPQARYRSSSHRARPLILHKCEECVVARQKCTWSMGDSCDRCRRLDKHCHPRKPSTVKEEERAPQQRSEQAPNDLYGVSDSAASAALALTELSAANNEESRSPPKPTLQAQPAPYKSPLHHVNVYQIPEAEVKRSPTQTMRSAPYYPERPDKSPVIGLGIGSRTPNVYSISTQPSMTQQNNVGQSTIDRRSPPYDLKNSAANHKKKQSKKGNNPHGNVGTYKCARCREFKAKEDRPCKRCALAGKNCGPKTLARENDNTPKKAQIQQQIQQQMQQQQQQQALQAQQIQQSSPLEHKPQIHAHHMHAQAPPYPYSHHLPHTSLQLQGPLRPVMREWSLEKPLIPQILEMVGPGANLIGEISNKLVNELSVLHAKVNENTDFSPPPSQFPPPVAPTQPPSLPAPAAISVPASTLNVPTAERGRAVSLPPILPDHTTEVTEPMQDIQQNGHTSKSPVEQITEDPRKTERRPLGTGLPQYQPYCTQCALDQGIPAQEATPASHTHFNQHPKAACRLYHPGAVKWRVGCSLHRGVMDEMGRCSWCNKEKSIGGIILCRSLRQTMGYPGDEYL